jgi:hypothetical protein
MAEISYLQNAWPPNTCYGCGPSNIEGMHIKSRWSDDGKYVIAEYMPDPKYNSGMPDVMYGGTVASLIDCHSVWTAIAFAHRAESRDIGSNPPLIYVTGELSVRYIKPTPLSVPVHLRAWAGGDIGRKIRVICELGPAGKVTASGIVTAVRL